MIDDWESGRGVWFGVASAWNEVQLRLRTGIWGIFRRERFCPVKVELRLCARLWLLL